MPGTPDPRRRGLTPLTVREAGGEWLIDMSGLRWCDPLHLAGAAALARDRGTRGGTVRVLGPLDPDARTYAARMRLGKVLDDLGAAHDFPVVPEHDRTADLLEVRPVRNEDDAVELAELVARRARAQSPQASTTLFACVVEMALNVADHAGVVGYVAAQTFPRRRWIRFAVADTGRGLLATLADRGADDDKDAVRLALSGTSRLPGRDRGTGLPITRRELLRADGWLLLASGSARLVALTEGDRLSLQRPAFPGTLVQGALRIGDRVGGEEYPPP